MIQKEAPQGIEKITRLHLAGQVVAEDGRADLVGLPPRRRHSRGQELDEDQLSIMLKAPGNRAEMP